MPNYSSLINAHFKVRCAFFAHFFSFSFCCSSIISYFCGNIINAIDFPFIAMNLLTVVMKKLMKMNNCYEEVECFKYHINVYSSRLNDGMLH